MGWIYSDVLAVCECLETYDGCHTVYIGSADSNSPAVTVGNEYDTCSSEPLNEQQPTWGDTFDVVINGNSITVTRTDSDSGWGQGLEIECCITDLDACDETQWTVEIYEASDFSGYTDTQCWNELDSCGNAVYPGCWCPSSVDNCEEFSAVMSKNVTMESSG